MEKKGIELVAFIFSVTLTAVLLNGCTSVDSTPVSMGELDSLNLLTLDSTHFQLTTADLRGAFLAVVYNPWCEHCQAEAEEIHQNLRKLDDVTVLMIGCVSLEALRNFSVKYGLNNFKNVKFAYASPVAAYKHLGANQLPHLRLYDKNITPIKDFTTTTSVNVILSHLKE